MGQSGSVVSGSSKYQGLFTELELGDIQATYQAICRLGSSSGGDQAETANGFSLSQLQDFLRGKLPESIVGRLYTQLEAQGGAKGGAKQPRGVSSHAFVATMETLLKGTLEEQGGLLLALVTGEGAEALSVFQVSKLIDSMLTAYEEGLKASDRMNNWQLTSAAEANQKFVDFVLEPLGKGGKAAEATAAVSQEEFVHWLQQTPLVQQVFADVFHRCFTQATSPAATASADTDTSLLHHMPSLPACQDVDWRKVTSQLDIPTLLVLNQSLPHHLRDQWRFLYSSGQHGASFATLLSHVTRRGPTVLLVRDTRGRLFGGFAAESWEIGPSFTGSSRCLLFTLAPKLGIYETSGQNDHYMYLNIDQQTLPNGLGMGGQFDYFGLWLDQEFGTGHSKAHPRCTTYGSPQLSADEDFTIDLVEVWAVGPPPTKPEEEDEDAKKSVLDKDPEAQALLELVGKGRKSEGLREEDPMADIPEVHEMPTK